MQRFPPPPAEVFYLPILVSRLAKLFRKLYHAAIFVLLNVIIKLMAQQRRPCKLDSVSSRRPLVSPTNDYYYTLSLRLVTGSRISIGHIYLIIKQEKEEEKEKKFLIQNKFYNW